MNVSAPQQTFTKTPSFFERQGAPKLAYHLTEGTLPGVVFLGGFRSDMQGSKALALEAYCIEKGIRFLRFDYSGHGQSEGDFMKLSIGDWKQDVLDMLDHLVPGKNIVVGSSMGGWLMLLAALARPKRVACLVGIASAPDFTEKLIWDKFTDAQKNELESKGVVYTPNCYDDEEPYPLTKHLIEEGRNHLVLDRTIDLDIPVRLLHGIIDEDVPWQVSVKTIEAMTTQNAAITLIKNGNHRLSEPDQLEKLCDYVQEVRNIVK